MNLVLQLFTENASKLDAKFELNSFYLLCLSKGVLVVTFFDSLAVEILD